MRFNYPLAALSLLTAFPLGVASAQDMERVMVTANRIDIEDIQAAPAVYRRVPADFVLVEVTFQSATRDAGERQKELETMFKRLKAKVAATDGVSLSGGDLGQSTSDIETVLFTDVYNSDYNGTGNFTLILSIDTKAEESFDRLMQRAEDFVMSIETDGRAEAYLGTEQFIGARNVTQHRADLITDIATEVSNLKLKFGMSGSKVTLTGLENRIVTQPSGPLELEIFIPYTLTLESGSGD